jgi:hypothetical protein
MRRDSNVATAVDSSVQLPIGRCDTASHINFSTGNRTANIQLRFRFGQAAFDNALRASEIGSQSGVYATAPPQGASAWGHGGNAVRCRAFGPSP